MELPRLHSFAPVVAPGAGLIILGSMPGAASLAAGEYYAHPQNIFWRLMITLFNAPSGLSYHDRKQLLTRHGIALWDVLASCIRPGSLDSDIAADSIMINDIPGLLETYPTIERLYFNGSTAERLFRQHVRLQPMRSNRLACKRLPSTSPANARYSFDDTLEEWKVIVTGKIETGLEAGRND